MTSNIVSSFCCFKNTWQYHHVFCILLSLWFVCISNVCAVASSRSLFGFCSCIVLCYREGSGKPLQYSCLESPMDGGAWQTTVHGVAESDTTEVTEHACSTLLYDCIMIHLFLLLFMDIYVVSSFR